MNAEPWQAEAACAGRDGDAWFAEGQYHNYDEARAVCVKECAVRQQCLEMALNDTLLNHGMYGGYTPDQRADMRRAKRNLARRVVAS